MWFQGMAQARSYEELTTFVDQNTERITSALQETSADGLMLSGNFEFRRLFLRLQAKVGFDIETGKIELIPELELVFQKELGT